MTAKPPTPQGISALLRKAGFERSEVTSMHARNWGRSYREYSDGYQVRKSPGSVTVTRRPRDVATRDEWLTKYAEAISGAGYEAFIDAFDVIVTAAGE